MSKATGRAKEIAASIGIFALFYYALFMVTSFAVELPMDILGYELHGDWLRSRGRIDNEIRATDRLLSAPPPQRASNAELTKYHSRMARAEDERVKLANRRRRLEDQTPLSPGLSQAVEWTIALMPAMALGALFMMRPKSTSLR